MVYRGLSGFVKILFNDISFGFDVNCINLYGIIFLYFVKLKVGIVNSLYDERDYW